MAALRSRRALAVSGAFALVVVLLTVPAAAASGSAAVAPLGTVGGLAPSGGGHDSANSSPHPAPFTWTNGKIDLTLAGESPTFYVTSLEKNSTNVSVSVLGIAEVTPNGTVVAVASLSNEQIGWNASWVNGSGGTLQVNLTGTAPVGSANGPWNASELPEQDGGGAGAVAVRLVFHLTRGNATLSPWTVTFDVGAVGWPWVAASDRLGVVLSLHSIGSSSLQSGSDDVEEHANATGSLIATLSWGPSASVTYANGTNATAHVSSGLSVSSDDQDTHVRLLFEGVAGGYPSLFYDPSVTMNPAATVGSGAPPGTGFLGLSGIVGGLVGVGAGIAVVGVLGWVAFRRGSANPRDRLRGRADQVRAATSRHVESDAGWGADGAP